MKAAQARIAELEGKAPQRPTGGLFEGVRNLLAGSGSGPLAAEAAQPLLPPDSPYPVDLAQDAAADADYDVASDDSGFDGGGSVDL
ncbi:MAG: hypothetical protein KIT25_11050 [Enhydrobacter sp.]|nr:MAG: hypothetical protein KIT25_11050 [Enhydrobacter sp.]